MTLALRQRPPERLVAPLVFGGGGAVGLDLGAQAFVAVAADFTIQELRDTRDLYSLRLTDGRTFEGHYKYTDIVCRANVRGDRLDVVHTALLDGDHITFRHEVPVARLLWRKGPSDFYGEGSLIAETAEAVFVEPLQDAAHLDGAGRSPITIEATPR